MPQLTLRSGTDIVCVYNLNTYTTGKEKISTLKANQKFNPFNPKIVQPKDPTLQIQRDNQNTLHNNANIGTSYDQNNMPLDPTGFNNLPNKILK